MKENLFNYYPPDVLVFFDGDSDIDNGNIQTIFFKRFFRIRTLLKSYYPVICLFSTIHLMMTPPFSEDFINHLEDITQFGDAWVMGGGSTRGIEQKK